MVAARAAALAAHLTALLRASVEESLPPRAFSAGLSWAATSALAALSQPGILASGS